jgi:tetratricopeptide (TPR) repeat protein
MMARPLFLPLFLAAALPLASGVARTAAPADGAAFQSVPELEAGFRLLYEQKFPEGREIFLAWEKEHPDEPFGHIATAASYLFEEFYRQGVLTSDFFLDDKKLLHGIKGKPDAKRMEGFRQERERAIEAAQQRLKKDAKDAEALFALTLAAGMQADALSILEKKNLDSLKQIKEADADAKRLLAVRPDAADAWLALGVANYILGSMSGTTRFFLWFGGIHGDRQLGMEQLQKSAESGHYLRPFAKILLALAARREKQNVRARELLRQLKVEFPQSPLFAAEYALAQDRLSPSTITR